MVYYTVIRHGVKMTPRGSTVSTALACASYELNPVSTAHAHRLD